MAETKEQIERRLFDKAEERMKTASPDASL